MGISENNGRILTRMLSEDLYLSPYRFAMWAYSWREGDLKQFDGPRKWQRDVMEDIERYLIDALECKKRGDPLPDFYKHSIASGRGPGKSALVGMLCHWFESTRIGGSVWVAANGEPQLRTKTFPEIAKWFARGINSEFFDINAMSIQPATWFKNYIESPEGLQRSTRYYYTSGQLWSEETPDSFAGAHNFDGEFAIFDEASGIPSAIWKVQEGVFTEDIVDRFWLTFSNPRSTEGAFFECFHKNRKFWRTTQIDSRTVEGVSQKTYENIIEQHGEDSDEARVEVYGQFPKAGADQFIPPFLVDAAIERKKWDDDTAPVVIGIDPARGGLDSTVIVVRKGRDLLAIHRYSGEDTMMIVGRVIEAIERWNPDLTVIDEGGLGYGILDRLVEQRYKVRGVNFGWKASNTVMYGNKRAEMWGQMKEWLGKAHIPDDKLLKDDLTSPRKEPDSSGTIFLESKKKMRARGLASPDCFISGTMIDIVGGKKPIELVVVGDEVITPFGTSPVIKIHKTTAESLTTAVFSNGASLIGKGTHRVFTFDKGWVRMDALSLTNEIESNALWSRIKWKILSLLFTRVKSSSFKHLVDTISQGGRTSRKDYYTEEFISNILGQFLISIMSIIRTMIGLTTPKITLHVFSGENIAENTQQSSWLYQSTEQKQFKHYENQALLQRHGTDQKQDLNGTKNTGKIVGLEEKRQLLHVNTAKKNSILFSQQEQNYAHKHVDQINRTIKIKQLMERAWFAVKHLFLTNIGSKNVVPVSVVTSKARVETYNLTLLNDNAYYANGILVENCADALCVTFAYSVAHRESKTLRDTVALRNSNISKHRSGAWMN